MAKPVLKNKWQRRDARAKKIKMCGVCKGRGRPKDERKIVCRICNGSGLNCSMQRAAEIEKENQPDNKEDAA